MVKSNKNNTIEKHDREESVIIFPDFKRTALHSELYMVDREILTPHGQRLTKNPHEKIIWRNFISNSIGLRARENTITSVRIELIRAAKEFVGLISRTRVCTEERNEYRLFF